MYKRIGMIFLMAVIAWVFIVRNVEAEIYTYEKYIGEEFVLDRDTTTIVSYSLLYSTLTLSNGVEVSIELVKKQK